MRERSFTIPELLLIVGTRAALGVGIGLLAAGRMSDERRRGAGWALVAVGVLTTIPLAWNVLSKPALSKPATPDREAGAAA